MNDEFDAALTGLVRHEERRFLPGGQVEVTVAWNWMPGFGPAAPEVLPSKAAPLNDAEHGAAPKPLVI